MQRISIAQAGPGMVTAKDVLAPDGRVLCGPGVTLTAEIIERLARSGVTVLTVEGRPVKVPGEKSLKERLRDLDARFARVKDDPVLVALMKLIAQHWIEEERGPARPAGGPTPAP
ncbi:hypothetical protein [Dissulfurirhabdus thermomarina]|uniref:hypothetical protein n=1 Tax=Dissulfurirhabdus thermomarina TaxID=1765737 RepID=UPI0015E896E2|nr:hypothetical protein [Dissulfurirhabdus thermomarina]